jgi:hypothetical protein
MFGGLVDLLRRPRAAVRTFAVFAAATLSAALAAAFLGAAAFVVVLDRYGPVHACVGAAGVFLVLAVVLAAVQAAIASRRRREARQAATNASLAALSDPRAILIGLQVAQAVGFRRLLPLLAIAGTAFAVANARPSLGNRRGEARHRRPSNPTAAPPYD